MSRFVSTLSVGERFWAKASRRDGDSCWLWSGAKDSSGYGQFKYGGVTQRAHRIAWLLTHGVLPGPEVYICHHCDIRLCVNPSHLFAGSAKDNKLDSVVKGRHHHGQKHHSARLTETQVMAMRASKERTSDLARRYNVDHDTARQARLGITWKHLG